MPSHLSSTPSTDSDSSFDLPPEHYTRQRKMPSFTQSSGVSQPKPASAESDFELPPEHHTRSRQMPVFRSLTTQEVQSSSPESDYELPMEHHTRKRLIPSFQPSTRPLDSAESSDEIDNSHPPPSPSPSGSSFAPPSVGITFDGNPGGIEEPSAAGEADSQSIKNEIIIK